MGNKHRGYVEIVLDKPRHLRYDLNALAEIEDTLGISLLNLQTILTKNLGLKAIKIIIWSGLLHEDQQLTPQHVGSLIDGDNIKYAIEKMSEALAAAFMGLKEKNVKGDLEEKDRGTGMKPDNSPSDPLDLNPTSSGI